MSLNIETSQDSYVPVSARNMWCYQLLMEQAQQVYAECFNGPPWFEKWTVDRAREFLRERYVDPGGLFVLQREKSRLTGFACGIAAQSSRSHLAAELCDPLPRHCFAPDVFYFGELCILPASRSFAAMRQLSKRLAQSAAD